MAQTRLEGDYYVNGQLSAKSLVPPSGSVTNTSVAAGSAGTYLDRTKSQQGFTSSIELFGPAVTITAVTKLLHVVRGATGKIVSAEAIIIVQATGADRTVTVDIQKSTGGGAFATICTTTINITNTTVIRTPVAATLNSGADYVDGDIFQLVVTVAGAAGAQAQGLLVTVNHQEDPQ